MMGLDPLMEAVFRWTPVAVVAVLAAGLSIVGQAGFRRRDVITT
jgi:hypothetical protein